MFLQQTLPKPAENLALDEALLESAEQGLLQDEVLRCWQADCVFVVLGRSGRVADEVYASKVREDRITLIRRSSGGGTILAGPGCMFFSLVLSLESHPALRMVDSAHQWVLSQLVNALAPLTAGLAARGASDLTVEDLKVGGNSMRIRRNWLLYHGTLLLNMDLHQIHSYLRHPPREPTYRSGRSHLDFVRNLNQPFATVEKHLRNQFKASTVMQGFPLAPILQLCWEKYENDEWTYQR